MEKCEQINSAAGISIIMKFCIKSNLTWREARRDGADGTINDYESDETSHSLTLPSILQAADTIDINIQCDSRLNIYSWEPGESQGARFKHFKDSFNLIQSWHLYCYVLLSDTFSKNKK